MPAGIAPAGPPRSRVGSRRGLRGSRGLLDGVEAGPARLPRLWAQVTGLHVEAWQAGRVADATMVLDPAAAAWVDAQVASGVAKVGDTQLGRLVGEAIARFDPVLAEQERTARADQRRFHVHLGHTGVTGQVTGAPGRPVLRGSCTSTGSWPGSRATAG